MKPGFFQSLPLARAELFDGSVRAQCVPRAFKPLPEEQRLSFEEMLKRKMGDAPVMDPKSYWQSCILRLQHAHSHLATPDQLSIFFHAIHNHEQARIESREKSLRLYQHLIYLDQYYLNPCQQKPLHAWLTLPTLAAHMSMHLLYYRWQSTPRASRRFNETISSTIELGKVFDPIENHLRTSEFTLTDLIIIAYTNSLDALHQAVRDQAMAETMQSQSQQSVIDDPSLCPDAEPTDQAMLMYYLLPGEKQAAIQEATTIPEKDFDTQRAWLEKYFVWLMKIAKRYRPDDMAIRTIKDVYHEDLSCGHVPLCIEQLTKTKRLSKEQLPEILNEEQRIHLSQRSAPTPPRDQRKSVSPITAVETEGAGDTTKFTAKSVH